MKIYCSSCGKVQPVIIDDCRDAKTGEPFQDIVCAECSLVIASGTDIRATPLAKVSPLEFVTMVLEKEHLVGKPMFWAEWPNEKSL